MRKKMELTLLFVTFAMLVIAAPALGAGWTPQASGTTNDLMGVDSYGYWCWAVGSAGTIVATSDGATWTAQISGTANDLNAVDFIDATHGWAVGAAGTIVVTSDGGTTWTAQSSGTASELNAVDFIDASHGWAVGAAGTIVATSDGGTTWTAQSSGTTKVLFGVGMSDASNGWAVGAGGTMLRWGYTADSGPVWSARSSGTTNDLHAVSDVGGMIRAAGSGGAILFNGGYPTWTPETSGVTQTLYSVCWSERLTETFGVVGIVIGPSSWAVGEQGTIIAEAAGQSWTTQSSGTTSTLHGVVFSGEMTGWAVGDGGTILATSSGGRETIPPTTTLSGIVAQKWYRGPITGTLTATDDVGGSGVAYTEFRLDAGDWTQGTSVPVSGEGGHVLLYRSADFAGNIEADKMLLFGIDTFRPSTRAPYAVTAARGKTATLRYKVVDPEPNGGTATVTIKVKNPAGTVVRTLGPYKGKAVNTLLSAKLTVPRTWKTGTYRFYVYAKDRAGNQQAKVASNKLVVR